MVPLSDGISQVGTQSMLFDLFKALDQMESSRKSIFFRQKAYFPAYVRNMFWLTI